MEAEKEICVNLFFSTEEYNIWIVLHKIEMELLDDCEILDIEYYIKEADDDLKENMKQKKPL